MATWVTFFRDDFNGTAGAWADEWAPTTDLLGAGWPLSDTTVGDYYVTAVPSWFKLTGSGGLDVANRGVSADEISAIAGDSWAYLAPTIEDPVASVAAGVRIPRANSPTTTATAVELCYSPDVTPAAGHIVDVGTGLYVTYVPLDGGYVDKLQVDADVTYRRDAAGDWTLSAFIDAYTFDADSQDSVPGAGFFLDNEPASAPTLPLVARLEVDGTTCRLLLNGVELGSGSLPARASGARISKIAFAVPTAHTGASNDPQAIDGPAVVDYFMLQADSSDLAGVSVPAPGAAVVTPATVTPGAATGAADAGGAIASSATLVVLSSVTAGDVWGAVGAGGTRTYLYETFLGVFDPAPTASRDGLTWKLRTSDADPVVDFEDPVWDPEGNDPTRALTIGVADAKLPPLAEPAPHAVSGFTETFPVNDNAPRNFRIRLKAEERDPGTADGQVSQRMSFALRTSAGPRRVLLQIPAAHTEGIDGVVVAQVHAGFLPTEVTTVLLHERVTDGTELHELSDYLDDANVVAVARGSEVLVLAGGLLVLAVDVGGTVLGFMSFGLEIINGAEPRELVVDEPDTSPTFWRPRRRSHEL